MFANKNSSGSPLSKNQQQALARCEAFNATLAEIDGDIEYEFLQDLFRIGFNDTSWVCKKKRKNFLFCFCIIVVKYWEINTSRYY